VQERVRGFRNHHDNAVFHDGEWAERGEITLEAAAKLIGVCNMTALRMLRQGHRVPAHTPSASAKSP
jgi:hypothetical protein